MWSSRYATASFSRSAASDAVSRSTPQLASASTNVTPSASRRSRTSSGSSVPAHAEEPSRLRPNRAPSSSAQSTNRTPIGGVVPARESCRTVSSAVISPSAPSSQPPLGTASMCDPTIMKWSSTPAIGAQRLPAWSRSGSRPSSTSFAVSHDRASCQSGDQASRFAPANRPPLLVASSSRSAMTACGSSLSSVTRRPVRRPRASAGRSDRARARS
jgi:hypothetical protein